MSENKVGWKSKDGMLEIVGFHKEKYKKIIYKVFCVNCSNDVELFPNILFDIYFTKLNRGVKPCGCSGTYRWTKEQVLIRCKRLLTDNVKIIGVSGEYNGIQSKLAISCELHGEQIINAANLLRGKKKRGCPVCVRIETDANQRRSADIYERCMDKCREFGYDGIGFEGEYTNAIKSRFKFMCPEHGEQSIGCSHLLYYNSKCPSCRISRMKERGYGYGYIPAYKDKVDYLYVIKINDSYLKIGRTINIKVRFSRIYKIQEVKKVEILKIYTGTHENVYRLEQETHENFTSSKYKGANWSGELFNLGIEDAVFNFINKSENVKPCTFRQPDFANCWLN